LAASVPLSRLTSHTRRGSVLDVRRKHDMFLTPWMLVQAILLALGIWWCMEMFPRWRDDLGKLRKPDDRADRAVVIILWSITAVVAFLCIRFGLTIGGNIVGGIRDVLR